MIVCLDTNVVLRLFGRNSGLERLVHAFAFGHLTVAVSTGIWLEYQEIAVRIGGPAHWERIDRLFRQVEALHGTVRHVEPSFHFHTIAADADDDAFADCAIAAEADYVITEDRHFDVLASAGYKVRAITPEEFIRQHLAGA